VGTARPSTLVDRLRGDVRQRPVVDRGLAGGLRAWLEDGVATAGPADGDGWPVVVDRRALTAVGDGRSGPPTVTQLRGAMVGRLFGQVVLTGQIGNPVDDALASMDAAGRSELVAFARRLRGPERRALYAEVNRQATTMAGQWSSVAPGWLPRVGARMNVPLAGGRVVLRAVADLVLGDPSDGQASVCLVDVRTGDPHPAHPKERRFLALLETVRSGAPPFRAATYYPALGELVVDDVDDRLLATAVDDVLGTDPLRGRG